jgi:hypothetical protein
MVLGLTAVLAFVSLVISRGLQGNPWAMAFSVALFALVLAFMAYAAVFGLVYMVSKVWNRRSAHSRPASPGVGTSVAPREHVDLVPPASELG